MPLPSTAPAATSRVIEMMPHAMPNIVSIVRRLWAQSVASVSRSKSWNDMALRPYSQLLQNDLLFLVEAVEDFCLHAVRNAQLHTEFFLAVFSLGVGNLNRSLSLFVINQRGFGNHQHVLLFLEEDFGVRAHIGLELAARIGNRDAHLESGHVVFLLAQWRNLGDLTGEFLVPERFHHDAGGLAEKDLPDVRFFDLALHVDFADVAQRHDQGS